ncbi:hypothetical protein ACH9EU_09045 [Kocuria sp. M1R5S2]|uniref:hypothetical protein n=1 Tax=Kocuria rhizosphaerae TaxID=3376285 RepID=UPI0037BA8A53
MSTHVPEPEYGQRLPHQDRPASPSRPVRTVPPLAARRMVRGLSFTLVLLGLLVGAGLAALGHSWGWAAGTPLVLPGLAGFVLAQRHPALRDPAASPRPRSRLWLIPWSLLLLGLLPLAGTFAVDPVPGGSGRGAEAGEHVAVLVVAGMTLVVAAAIGFALVAVASFTVRDDDDSPLRPTGYAERDRRAGRDPGPGTPGNHYDSEWVRRPRRVDREPRHGGSARHGATTRHGGDTRYGPAPD